MSFDELNLSMLSHANGFTLWHYTTADRDAEVQRRGYFNKFRDVLHRGDLIIAISDAGGVIRATVLLVAHSAPPGDVLAVEMSEQEPDITVSG